ncbi:hypothetical protein RM572_25025 [Streptomyces sp. DSM 42041]|uniref:Guanylate cyclase domain-containing protein n=1 Tax=Streptomyces hazeniae TaxID=3075538 RepID=A0ABU2NYG0_9ACTN|nr:hypothetical protein [Streptomyces sp. DSM 42041]MDT0382031.1 hypothetical protein [Streptomyces sp. DSM 42041]
MNRTILLFDIEQFGRRDDVEQAFLRRSLHDVVEDTLSAADVEPTQQYREDRGDGLILLLSGDVSKVALLRALLTSLPDALSNYNRLAAASTQMRLRIVLAVGEVALDPRDGTLGGVVGHDLNQACRLLDAEVLRDALRSRQRSASVVCVSDTIYQGVVRHGHRGVAADAFHRVGVLVKEGELTAWLHGPPAEDPADRGAEPETGRGTRRTGGGAPTARGPAPGTPADTGGGVVFEGSPDIGGSVAGRDLHGVSGGHVAGDVYLGSRREDRR